MNAPLLKKVALFQYMTAAELLKLSSALREARYSANTHIFHEGNQGSGMFIIIDGKVRISKTVPGIGEEAMAILEPGSYFGEMSLIEDRPRSADAIAHSDCQLYELSREQFDYLTFIDKEITMKLLWSFVRTLSDRLRETNAKMQSLIVLSSYGPK